MRVARGLALFILLLPSASAGVGVEGELLTSTPVFLDGRIRVTAPDATLDLAKDAPGLELSFARAVGVEVERRRDLFATPVNHVSPELPRMEQREIRYGAGTISGLACQRGCEVFLFAPDRIGALAFEGDATGEPGRTAGERAHWAGGPRSVWGFTRIVPAGAWLVGDDPEALRVVNGAPFVEGNVSLLLWNVSGRVTTAEGSEAFTMGVDREFDPVAGDAFAKGESRARFRVLHLEDARLVASPAGSQAVFAAAAPRFTLQGALVAPAADGWVDAGGRRALDAQDVEVVGALSLAPRDVAGDLVTPSRVAWRMEGDAESVAIAGAAVANERTDLVGPSAVGAAALLLVLGWLARASLIGLYTRLRGATVATHPRRQLLLDRVTETPGIVLAKLAREAGVARPVARHHVAILLRHGHLVSRRHGRATLLFPVGLVPDATGVAARAASEAGTRGDLADLLAKAPAPMTQRELSAASGLTVRLVSYHLARLVAAGLVEEAPTFPRRYASRMPVPRQTL